MSIILTGGIAQNSQDPAKAMEFLEFAYTNADFMNLFDMGNRR